MQTISSLNPARAPRRIIAISIGLLSTLLLESCGGGGSTDPNATAQSVDDGTKTIQAVSGSTAVPRAWTGRAPKMEVINGITVPPEPAPAINNATLAGVDVNHNGVRDDVERVIARRVVSTEDYTKATALARYFQNIVARSTQESREEAVAAEKLQSCALAMPGRIPAELLTAKSSEYIGVLTANNSTRKAKYQLHYKAIGWLVDIEEVKCE